MQTNNRVTDAVRDEVRSAIEDRALWLYLIVRELSESGKIEKLPEIERAIFEFGRLKGIAMPSTDSAGEWARNLISPVGEKVFEQKLVKADDDEAIIEFSYCPLVESWRKAGASGEETASLCRIAKCGDHGRISPFPLELTFEKLLADGDDVCRLVISRKLI